MCRLVCVCLRGINWSCYAGCCLLFVGGGGWDLDAWVLLILSGSLISFLGLVFLRVHCASFSSCSYLASIECVLIMFEFARRFLTC